LSLFRLACEYPSYYAIADDADIGDAIVVAGYDPKRGPLTSRCAIESKDNSVGVIKYGCDTVKGMSGASVIRNGALVGIHLGYENAIGKNIAVNLSQLDSKKDVHEIQQLVFERCVEWDYYETCSDREVCRWVCTAAGGAAGFAAKSYGAAAAASVGTRACERSCDTIPQCRRTRRCTRHSGANGDF
jgi:hypothetical protein